MIYVDSSYHWLIHSEKTCVFASFRINDIQSFQAHYLHFDVLQSNLTSCNLRRPPQWILKYWILTPLAYSSTMAHFVAHPGTWVHNGNQQEVTGDKWMLTNVMSDGNYPSHSDFHGLCFLFLTLFYCSAAEHRYSSRMHTKATLCTALKWKKITTWILKHWGRSSWGIIMYGSPTVCSLVYWTGTSSHREHNVQFVLCCAPHGSNPKDDSTHNISISSQVKYDTCTPQAEVDVALKLF